MWHAQELQSELNELENGQQWLPQMTAVFVEGLQGDSGPRFDAAAFTESNEASTHDCVCFRVPMGRSHRMTKREIASFCLRVEKPSCKKRRSSPDRDLDALRHFICGISNCFNNILMGIWGNVSLLSMTIDKGHPMRQQLMNMDRLIQNGALLIQSLFGYMAERRMETKHLRMVQLVQEIYDRIKNTQIEIDIPKIEKGMELASHIRHPAVVAQSMARVLDQLLHWINSHLQSIQKLPNQNLKVRRRLKIIKGIINQGFQTVQHLELYSGARPPQKKMTNLKTLVRHQIKAARGQFEHLEISAQVSDQLPAHLADRSQLGFVLDQLIANAAHAMPDRGSIQVTARSILEEAPAERCVVNQACDYSVISVSDNGMGMSKKTQANIFSPFFVGDPKSNMVGLGLAAAVSVVKRHGGYIQVTSAEKVGSTFKVYLPTDDPATMSITTHQRSKKTSGPSILKIG